jgi:hypothetical protein
MKADGETDERQTGREKNKATSRNFERLGRQVERQTGEGLFDEIKTGRHVEREAGKQINRQADRKSSTDTST